MKKIYLIRHAESEANAAVDLDNPTYYYDARITERGESQALKVKNVLENIHFDTYICSPLTRTLQTFSIIFPDNKPIIEPLIREHLFHSCDVGRQPSSLKKDFTSFDFSNLQDFWWNNNKPINEKKIVKENFNDIKNRLDKFKLWLNKSNSNTIALVSHGTFLSQITGYMLENCEHYVWEY
ncbi:phosphoglycerate mutase family protein [Pelagibacteraceae bacterium]|nr:phosphoglycerate mutase family protein [Pelagibacteraceae bacterium]